MKKIILYLMILSSISLSVYAAGDVDNYVNQLVKDELAILNNKSLSESKKIEESEKLIKKNMDFDWMAKFTLGGFRKTLECNQISEFTKVYNNYVSKAYADLVKNYQGQEPKILRVESLPQEEYMVSMTIGTVNVKYLIRQTSNGLKVSDIITEGVSLINSQQSEFMNILSGQGYDALISDLKAKSK